MTKKSKMKRKILFFTIKSALVLFNTGIFLIATSCSSRENSEIVPEDTNKVSVYINTSVFDNENIINTSIASTGKTIRNSSSSEIIAKERMVYGDVMDALISMEKQKSEQSYKINTSASTSKSGAIAQTTTAMLSGKQFVVRLFNDNNGNRGTLYGEYTLTAGQATPIRVDSGKNYHWIAYSTNENTLPAIAGNVISANDMINKDILYDSGILANTQTGNNYLEIIFKHKASRFHVLMNSQGMFMPMSMTKGTGKISVGNGTGAAFKSLLTTRSFDVLQGEYINTAQLVNEVPLADTNFTNALKDVYMYSSDEVVNIPANSLVIKISNILFKPDHMPGINTHDGLWGYTIPLYFGINNNSFNISRGATYEITAKLLQSGVKFGNTIWAKGPLTNAPSIGANNILAYRITPYNTLNNHSSLFWRWNELAPNGNGSTGPAPASYTEDKDPCMQLYPSGLWRMPTAAEAQEIANADPISTQGWLQPDPGNTSASYFNMSFTPDTGGLQYFYGLRFQFMGYIDNNTGIQENKATINSGDNVIENNAVSTRFWTKDNTGATAKAFVRYANFTAQSGQGVTVSVPNKGLITDMNKKHSLNIRCVRN